MERIILKSAYLTGSELRKVSDGKSPGKIGLSRRVNSTLRVSISRNRERVTLSPTFNERTTFKNSSQTSSDCPLIAVIMSPPSINSVPTMAIGSSPPRTPPRSAGLPGSTDELALRGHQGMLDDEVFLGHRMGSNHPDGPSLHCHLRRVGALLAHRPGASLV